MDTPNTLGARVRALRLQNGFSQRALAEGLVSKSMISQIEADKALPSADLLALLAERLGVTGEDLLPAKQNDVERADRFKQGQKLLALGHPEEALPLLQACLEDPHPSWPLAELCLQLGQCLQLLGQTSEARAHFEEALRLAVRDDKRRLKAELHMRLGRTAAADEQWNVALQEWKQAYQDLLLLLEAGESGLGRRTVEACLALGRAQAELGWHQEALLHFREAQARLQETEEPKPLRLEAEVPYCLGGALHQLGEHEAAEANLQQAVGLFRQLRDRRKELEASLLLAGLQAAAGRKHAALQALDACLLMAQRLAHSDLIAKVYFEQAVVYKQTEHWENAISVLHRALEIEGCTEPVKGGLHRLLAETYAEKERWDQALLEAEHACASLNEERSGEELYKVYRLLTTIYKQRGDYKVANDCVVHSNLLLQKQLLKKGWRV